MKRSNIYDSKKIVKTMLKSPRVMSCRDTADGGYWITDGFIAVKTAASDDCWREIGGAIFMQDAGAYTRDNRSGSVARENSDALAERLQKTVGEKGRVANVPTIRFADGAHKRTIAALYDGAEDTAVLVNEDYLALFSPECKFYVTAETSPIVVCLGECVIGIIMPIRSDVSKCAAVRAFFGKAEAAIHDDADKLRAVIRDTAARLDAAKGLVEEYRAQIEELKKQLADKPAPVDMPAQDPASAAHEAVKMFKLINGKIHAVIKGENTGAPVIWLDNIDGIAAADLEKAGAAYSNKRGAWYYRVTARA